MNAKDERNSKQKNHKGSTNKRSSASTNKKSKYRSNDGRKTDKFREEDNRGNTPASNSPDWYGGSSFLMQNAAQLSFNTGAGRAVRVRRDLGPTTHFELNPAGIMTFHTLNVPGFAANWNSPVNIASRKLYTFVRHVNSGHSNYDAVDLMMYIQLMDNAYSYYAWMVRVYGCMRTILSKNRYTPDGLIDAMGVSYSDIASKMADFRYYINLYSTKVNQMAVPAVMPLFNRHMWMYSNVYADAPSERAQFYLFNPHAFWRYVVTDTERYIEPSIMLPARNSSGGLWTLETIVSNGNLILNQVLQREDFNIMSGDIMKAYGDKLHRLNPIDEVYAIVPVYDPEVLLQIHNANLIHQRLGSEETVTRTWRIQEMLYDDADAGALWFNPTIFANMNARVLACDRVVDFPIEDPKPEHIAVATRLVIGVDASTTITDSNNQVRVGFNAFGTEMIMFATIHTATDSGSYQVQDVEFYNWKSVGGQYMTVLSFPMELLHFEMRPLFWEGNYPDSGQPHSDGYAAGVYGDLNNYAVLDRESLQNINEAAALALYGVA